MSGMKITAASLALALMTAGMNVARAENKALFRWVDEKGQVHYGDKVPPKAGPRAHSKGRSA